MGGEAAFVEKFPCYGGHRWGIRNFGYRCLLTMPEIELMGADLPHTLYKSKDAKKRSAQADVDDATAKMKEAYERKMRAREEERKQEMGLTVYDIFGGALETD